MNSQYGFLKQLRDEIFYKLNLASDFNKILIDLNFSINTWILPYTVHIKLKIN